MSMKSEKEDRVGLGEFSGYFCMIDMVLQKQFSFKFLVVSFPTSFSEYGGIV